MLIRPATPEDADAIWSILQPICAAGDVFCVPRGGGREVAFDYWFSGPNRQVFVAETEAGILGTSYLRPNQSGGGAHVANAGYATAPAARGRGIARALLAHSLETARAQGFRAMQFNFVVSTNTRAIALWESAGFAIVGRLPGAFAHPGAGDVDALVMYRALRSGSGPLPRQEAPPMLRNFEHVGMTVSDLDASLAFYRDLLGLRLVLRRASPGGEVAFLDAGGGQLEMVRPSGPVATPARRVAPDEAGLRHLTFTFDAVDATFDRLVAAGVRALEAPRDAHNRDVFARVAFVLDPDGIVVELAQRP